MLSFIFGCARSCFLCRLFSSFGEQGLVFMAVHGLLLWQGTGCRLHRLQYLQRVGSVVETSQWLSSCGAWTKLLRGMWDLPGSGITHVFCLGRQILYHWATREAQTIYSLICFMTGPCLFQLLDCFSFTFSTFNIYRRICDPQCEQMNLSLNPQIRALPTTCVYILPLPYSISLSVYVCVCVSHSL